jgi:hypothetical protein
MGQAKKLRSVPAELKPQHTDALQGPRGTVNRQEATLDPERTWLEVTCDHCGTQVYLEQPPEGFNLQAEEATEVVTLSDGSQTSVTAVMARPRSTLAFECPGCTAAAAEDENAAMGLTAPTVANPPRPVIREAQL